MTFVALIAFTIFSSFSAWAGATAKSYDCQSDPVTANGTTIVVKVSVQMGLSKSFKSLDYSYEAPDGALVSGSLRNGPNCLMSGREIIVCETDKKEKLIEAIGSHSTIGIGFSVVGSDKFHFLKCEPDKPLGGTPVAGN